MDFENTEHRKWKVYISCTEETMESAQTFFCDRIERDGDYLILSTSSEDCVYIICLKHVYFVRFTKEN